MVNKFKKFMIALCIMTLSFTTCAFAADNTSSTYNESDIAQYTQSIVSMLTSYSEAELEYNIDNSVGFNSEVCKTYYDFIKEDKLGAMKSFGAVTIAEEDEAVKATEIVSYEKMDVAFVVTYRNLGGSMAIFNIEAQQVDNSADVTLGEKLEKAAMNTVIGMGTVFIILIFISLIIGLFKYVNQFDAKLKAKKEAAEAPSEGVVNAVSQIVQNEENEEDDLELIAVITAAIAASEDAPTDGFVVRSIKKVNRRGSRI